MPITHYRIILTKEPPAATARLVAKRSRRCWRADGCICRPSRLALAAILQAPAPPFAGQQGFGCDPDRRLTVDAVEVRTFDEEQVPTQVRVRDPHCCRRWYTRPPAREYPCPAPDLRRLLSAEDSDTLPVRWGRRCSIDAQGSRRGRETVQVLCESSGVAGPHGRVQ
jgi:hypothetical protein